MHGRDHHRAPRRRLLRVARFVLPCAFDDTPAGRSAAWAVGALLVVKAVLSATVATGDTLAVYRFVTYWLHSGLANPWDYIALIDPAAASHHPPPFPYPPFMLIVLGLLRSVTYLLGLTSPAFRPLAGLSFKLGTFGCDLASGGLIYLIARQLGLGAPRARAAFLLWHFSGIAIYVTYLQGQFDIIPVFLTLLSLHMLLGDRRLGAALTLSLAVASKHYPLLLLCPWLLHVLADSRLRPRARLAYLLAFAAILAGTVAVLYGPFAASPQFREKVLAYEESQRVWLPVFVLIHEHMWIYLTVAYTTLVAMLAWAVPGRDPQRPVLVSFLLIMFTTFVIPMPTWYLWHLPFAVLLCGSMERGVGLFVLYNLAYLAYHSYFEYTALTQLCAYRQWGWPLAKSPFLMVRERLGWEAANRISMVTFSVLVASQVGIAVASLLARSHPRTARAGRCTTSAPSS